MRFRARAAVAAAAAAVVSFAAASVSAQTNQCSPDVGAPCPDLQYAGDIEVTVEESTVTFRIPVANRGDTEAPPTQVVASGRRLGSSGAEVGSLGPGQEPETATITMPIPDELRGESEGVSFMLDASQAVPESSEQNNRTRRSVSFPDQETPAETVTVTDTVTDTETVTDTVTDTETVTDTVTTTVTAEGEDGGSDTLLWAAAIGGVAAALATGAAWIVDRRRSARHLRLDWDGQSVEMSGPTAEPPEWPGEEAAAEPPPEPWPPEETAALPPVEPVPPARVVSTGFSDVADPGRPLDSTNALRPGGDYFFWLEVGELVAGTIEETPVELAEVETLAAGSLLTVVLFPVGESGSARSFPEGELILDGDGSVVVSRQPVDDPGRLERTGLVDRRLFFPVRTPGEEGTLRLRCSIYHKQILLQSRLVTARVSESPEPAEDALSSMLDFTLAPRLDPGHVGRLPEYRLSLLMNQTEDGTHSLTVKGGSFADAASFDSVELEDLLTQCRRSLRMAAWHSEEPWRQGLAYRYQLPSRANLETDLVTLAIWGKRFYVKVATRLAGASSRQELASALRTPGFVQLALKQSPRHLLPAALFYDHKGLVDTADLHEYGLCGEFLGALDARVPLADVRCFHGDCPFRESETTVCPSGFWGYRHALGIPVTLRDAPDVPLSIEYSGQPSMAVAVSTDPQFELRVSHEGELRKIRPDLLYADTRAEAVTLLKQGRAHVVYFYCHGGRSKNVPYISVGALTDEIITAVTLHNEDIQWTKPRPLVFVNGCHTTGVEPEQAFEFVSAFVSDAGAAGVIGTEITVFEPLARVFAEVCLRRFLAGAPLGWAVRDARLALLEEGNPLGLVYLPYALPSLQLVAS